MASIIDVMQMARDYYPLTRERNLAAEKSEFELNQLHQLAEERKGLKELFAKGKMPSISEMGAIDPETAIKIEQLNRQGALDQLNMLEKQGNIQKNQMQMSEQEQKIAAQHLGAAADQYDADIASGMPEAQALQKFHAINGRNIQMLQQAGIGTGSTGSYDPNQITPDVAHQTASAHGFTTNRARRMQAEATRLPPEWTQYGTPGSVQIGAGGNPIAVPGVPPGGFQGGYGQAPVAQPQAQQQAQPTGPRTGLEDLPIQMPDGSVLPLGEARQLWKSAPSSSPQSRAIQKAISDSIKASLPGRQQPQIMTPEQDRAAKLEQEKEMERFKTEESAKRKAGELEVEQEAANQKAINNYTRLRSPKDIVALIKDSIQGGGEAKINELANFLGVNLPEATPSAALEVIAQQMAKSSPFAPGSQSDKEFQARMDEIGNPASKIPAEQRLAKFEEWLRGQESLIAQSGKFSDEQLIDLVNEGYIGKETAAKVYKRMHSGGQ